MPGLKDARSPHADYMSDWLLHREEINVALDDPYSEIGPADPDTIVVKNKIDMSKSISALLHNSISLIFEKVAGDDATPIDVYLYVQLSGSHPLEDNYYQVGSAFGVDVDVITTFNLLYAGKYKILVDKVEATEYRVFESHFDIPSLTFGD